MKAKKKREWSVAVDVKVNGEVINGEVLGYSFKSEKAAQDFADTLQNRWTKEYNGELLSHFVVETTD